MIRFRSLSPLVVLVAVACSKSEPTAKPAASSSARPNISANAVASASAPASAAPPNPKTAGAFSGAWSGTYEAQHYRVEVPKGEGAREWKDDDGKSNTGSGKISLSVNDSGGVTGEASGPLGDQRVVGEVDGETLRVRFSPKEPGERAFSGFALLEKSGATLKGHLQASTGDSRTVRDAPIELTQGGAPSKPAPSGSAESPRPSRAAH